MAGRPNRRSATARPTSSGTTEIVAGFGLPCVVAVNQRPGDTDEELQLVRQLALDAGAFAAEICDGFAQGGNGAT